MGKYTQIKTLFEAEQNPETAIAMSKYMRNLFPFYGLPAPKRKSVYKDFLKAEKREQHIDWTFLDQCYDDPHREFQYLVSDYLTILNNCLNYDDIPHIKHYIQTKPWWDTIDFLDQIIGKIGLQDPRVGDLMLEWSTNEDFLLRRVAIDHQLSRKEQTDPVLLEQILFNNLGSDEFFINKAIGWSLRDYSKTNPGWVRHFITTYGSRMDHLSIREAGKYI